MPVARAIAAVCLAFGCALSPRARADVCANQSPPPGAQALGYSHLIFCVAPTVSDISISSSVAAKLYSGSWYRKTPNPLSLYSMSGGVLAIANGGGVMTETQISSPGALPLLLGSQGFYVEFAERLSDNDPDHWPAVWMMPQEHDVHGTDHLASDPPGYERWMELDVDEGGYNTGHLGTMISWYGVPPQYQHQNSSNAPASTFGMDRTQQHVFGLGYDPKGRTVTWWVDGASVGSVSTQAVPDIVNSYHYFLIINNQNHGMNHPYTLYVPYFSAWSSGAAPNPPSGVKAVTVP